MSRFGDILKSLIDQYEMKNNTVAEAVNYDKSYISKWLNSNVLPSPNEIKNICHVMSQMMAEKHISRDEHQNLSMEQRRLIYLETKNELYQSLFEAYQKDMHDRSIEKKVISVDSVQERKEILLNQLFVIRKENKRTEINILGNLVTIPRSEAVFLMEFCNDVSALEFEEGEINFFLPYDAFSQLTKGTTFIALINLFMIRSKVQSYVYRSLIENTGLVLCGENYYYVAQGNHNGIWMFENIHTDKMTTDNINRKISLNLMPTARKLIETIDLDHNYAGSMIYLTFYYPHTKCVLGMMGMQLSTALLTEQISSQLSADSSSFLFKQQQANRKALDEGKAYRFIVYREAIEKLVYEGKVFTGESVIILNPAQRLMYLQDLVKLIDRYDNLEIKVVDTFILKEVKHETLPNIYFGEGYCLFLNFPVDGKYSISLIKDAAFIQSAADSFESLWDEEELKLIDIRVVIDDYLFFCQNLTF